MKKIFYSVLLLGVLCSCDNSYLLSSSITINSSNVGILSRLSSSENSTTKEDTSSSNFDENSSSLDNSLLVDESSSILSSSSSSLDLVKYTLKGQIVDTNNIGVSGIIVKLLWNNEEIASIITDSNGEFNFTSLEEGVYRLTFVVNDSTYEIQGNHEEFLLSGEKEEFTYPVVILKKSNISYGELS